MASRSPVAIKTALARKIGGKMAVEINNIKAIDEGNGGLLPSSVESAIADSHNRITHRRTVILGEVDVAFTQFKNGASASDFLRLINQLPQQIYG